MSTLKFYPEHPTDEKTHLIETTKMPLLEQDKPFDVVTLYEEYHNDSQVFFENYLDKRFMVEGIANKVGPDIHNKPSIELSDKIGGKIYGLVIFPSEDHYKKVKVGDKVVVLSNYLVMSNSYGIVMKNSELVTVFKN